ncbi:hypothetical protein V8E54_000540 [Elaphomyces granulatus]
MPSLHLNSERVRQAGGYKISNHVRIEFPLSEEKSIKNEASLFLSFDLFLVIVVHYCLLLWGIPLSNPATYVITDIISNNTLHQQIQLQHAQNLSIDQSQFPQQRPASDHFQQLAAYSTFLRPLLGVCALRNGYRLANSDKFEVKPELGEDLAMMALREEDGNTETAGSLDGPLNFHIMLTYQTYLKLTS